jgi:HxlR-like helix-turn-helix
VARNILSARLRKLVEHRILERRRYQDRPPRFEYRLTERGLDLYPAIVALLQWGDRHAAHPAGRPLALEHKGCGRDSTPRLVCSECGSPSARATCGPSRGPGRLPKGRSAGGQITAISGIVNPDKLAHLGPLADYTSLLRSAR